MAISTTFPIRRRTNPVVRLFRVIVLLLLLAPIAAIGVSTVVFAGVRAVPAYREVDTRTLFAAVKAVAVAEIGETPHLTSRPPGGAIPLCADVPNGSIKPLRAAFALMRGTAEGRRLYQMLVDNGVCVTVRDLPYNAAYAETRRTFPNDWSASQIAVDRHLVRITETDLLAAVLVHESTHVDRAVSGKACFISNSCTVLPNGVDLDEELAAHTAEAQWWIAAFGTNGKRFAFGGDYGENQLVHAYLKGAAAFRDYVTHFRSDPREGEGIS